MAQPILRRQPFKGLYVTYFILSTVFLRIPLWLIWFLPKRNRPRASWTLSRCIRVRGYQVLTELLPKIGLRANHPVPNPDEELKNASLVWIDSLAEDSDVFCGRVRKAAEITGVKPARVPAYWFFRPGISPPKEVKARASEKTVLQIHGGAFHLGSAHPDVATSDITHGLVAHSKSIERILAVEYRLSATYPDPPANPIPAALLDCLAAYRYLVVDAGFEPQNIAVAGDSAGGNLAFALVRHLIENTIPSLPPPGRLVGFSSWLDLSFSRRSPEDSFMRNVASDIFASGPGARFGEYAVPAYLGPLNREEAKTNRYLSPSSPHITPVEGMFKGFPKTFISAGDAEILLDDSAVAAERLKADGVNVTVDIVPDAVHDFMVFKWHEPERTEALRRVCSWLDD